MSLTSRTSKFVRLGFAVALSTSLSCSAARHDATQPDSPAVTTTAPSFAGSGGTTAAPLPTASAGASSAASRDASARARLDAVAQRLATLSKALLGFWQAHGLDREYGGFHGQLDRKGEPVAPTDKGIIQQARHLWTFSTWYVRREPTPEIKAIADNLYRFIEQHFRDKDGEYRLKVTRAGKVVDKRKVLYADAFAIYALSAYSKAFGVKEAAEHALACFRSMDARAHDAVNGGYDQRRDAPWLTKGAAKETNTHLHLMEAYAALYEVTKDEAVRARVEEIVRMFLERIVQSGDYAHKDFLMDWKPFGPPVVSYGHDLETAWLLLETAAVLGRPNDPKIVETARRIGLHSAERGFDPEKGGYFEEGVPGGAPTKLEKVWWIQVEAIPALIELYRLTSDVRLLDKLERTLDFIERFQLDREYGELYWGVLADGSVGPHGDHKGEEWKASYHQLRAAVFGEDMIRRQ